jgi:hypothetical protein
VEFAAARLPCHGLLTEAEALSDLDVYHGSPGNHSSDESGLVTPMTLKGRHDVIDGAGLARDKQTT